MLTRRHILKKLNWRSVAVRNCWYLFKHLREDADLLGSEIGVLFMKLGNAQEGARSTIHVKADS